MVQPSSIFVQLRFIHVMSDQFGLSSSIYSNKFVSRRKWTKEDFHVHGTSHTMYKYFTDKHHTQ